MSFAKKDLASIRKRIGCRVDWTDFLGISSLVFLVIGFGMALIYAPTELIQGEPQRIFYLHLPMAINSYVSFLLVFVCSVGYLWKRNLRWDIWARSSAEVGLFFTTLVILTGGIWGQSTWGTFWQWEPRLTFTFILWLIFVAYMMLRYTAHEEERIARFASVLGIIGFANVPLIFVSVYLWRSLHPEPATTPHEIGVTLLVTTIGFLLLLCYLLIHRLRLELNKQHLHEIRELIEEEEWTE